MISLLRFAVKQDCQYQWLWEEVLSHLNIERAQIASHAHWRALLSSLKHLMTFEIVLGSLGIDLIAHLHELYYLRHEILGNSSLDSYISCMKVHVASLDAFHGKCSQSCQILGKTYRHHNMT